MNNNSNNYKNFINPSKFTTVVTTKKAAKKNFEINSKILENNSNNSQKVSNKSNINKNEMYDKVKKSNIENTIKFINKSLKEFKDIVDNKCEQSLDRLREMTIKKADVNPETTVGVYVGGLGVPSWGSFFKAFEDNFGELSKALEESLSLEGIIISEEYSRTLELMKQRLLTSHIMMKEIDGKFLEIERNISTKISKYTKNNRKNSYDKKYLAEEIKKEFLKTSYYFENMRSNFENMGLMLENVAESKTAINKFRNKIKTIKKNYLNANLKINDNSRIGFNLNSESKKILLQKNKNERIDSKIKNSLLNPNFNLNKVNINISKDYIIKSQKGNNNLNLTNNAIKTKSESIKLVNNSKVFNSNFNSKKQQSIIRNNSKISNKIKLKSDFQNNIKNNSSESESRKLNNKILKSKFNINSRKYVDSKDNVVRSTFKSNNVNNSLLNKNEYVKVKNNNNILKSNLPSKNNVVRNSTFKSNNVNNNFFNILKDHSSESQKIRKNSDINKNKKDVETKVKEINQKLELIEKSIVSCENALTKLEDKIYGIRFFAREYEIFPLNENAKKYIKGENITWGDIFDYFRNILDKFSVKVKNLKIQGKEVFGEDLYFLDATVEVLGKCISSFEPSFSSEMDRLERQVYYITQNNIFNVLEKKAHLQDLKIHEADCIQTHLIEGLNFYTEKIEKLFEKIKETENKNIVKFGKEREQKRDLIFKGNIEKTNEINKDLEEIEELVYGFKDYIANIRHVTLNTADVFLREPIYNYGNEKITIWGRVLRDFDLIFSKLSELMENLKMHCLFLSRNSVDGKELEEMKEKVELYKTNIMYIKNTFSKIERDIIKPILEEAEELNLNDKDDEQLRTAKENLRIYANEQLKNNIDYFNFIKNVAGEVFGIYTEVEGKMKIYNKENAYENNEILEKISLGQYEKDAEQDSTATFSEALNVAVREFNDLFDNTNHMYDYYGFDFLFLFEMKQYKEYIIKLENNPDYVVPAVDENNKEINNLRNRIGLIYYLYDNSLSKDIIDEDDVNKISELFNEILDIREFMNIYYSFKNYIYGKAGIYDSDTEKGMVDKKEKTDLKLTSLKNHLYWLKGKITDDFLGGAHPEIKPNSEEEFLKDYRDFYMKLHDSISIKIKELYSILEKGNGYKSLISDKTKEIEKSFRDHLYVKDNFETHNKDFNEKWKGRASTTDCRLLGADKSFVGDYKKDFRQENFLKDEFTKDVLSKNFNGGIKTEDLNIIVERPLFQD